MEPLHFGFLPDDQILPSTWVTWVAHAATPPFNSQPLASPRALLSAVSFCQMPFLSSRRHGSFVGWWLVDIPSPSEGWEESSLVQVETDVVSRSRSSSWKTALNSMFDPVLRDLYILNSLHFINWKGGKNLKQLEHLKDFSYMTYKTNTVSQKNGKKTSSIFEPRLICILKPIGTSRSSHWSQ